MSSWHWTPCSWVSVDSTLSKDNMGQRFPLTGRLRPCWGSLPDGEQTEKSCLKTSGKIHSTPLCDMPPWSIVGQYKGKTRPTKKSVFFEGTRHWLLSLITWYQRCILLLMSWNTNNVGQSVYETDRVHVTCLWLLNVLNPSYPAWLFQTVNFLMKDMPNTIKANN